MAENWQRDQDLKHLHPILRDKIPQLLRKLNNENIPFKLFEGFRSPQRQRYLYAKGRTIDGNIVTNARPWSSYHQYGMAADFVLYENRQWSWNDRGHRKAWWSRLHELGHELGLEPLSWEKPHLQIADLSISTLRNGQYPPDGDMSWASNFEAAIYSWNGQPPAPRAPGIIPERPAISAFAPFSINTIKTILNAIKNGLIRS